jgi:hypothetical protein
MTAAVAVVVSVIYLAKQISDNTKLLRSQSHYYALSLAQRPLELMVENESLAATVIQCNANPDAVAAATWERCLNYYLMQIDAWEYMYYQNIDGSIPRQLWVGADSSFKTWVKTKPGYARFWSETQGAFDEPFRSYAARQIPRWPPVRAGQYQ